MFKLTLLILNLFINTHKFEEIHFNCASKPCGDHGKCTDLYKQTAFDCVCDPGWTGELCSIEFNHTDSTTLTFLNRDILDCGGECINGGICESNRCICNPRFSGRFCQHGNFGKQTINANKQECVEKCISKNIENKKTCNYMHHNITVTCRCENEYDIIGEMQCSDVFENFAYCKLDCQEHFRLVDKSEYNNTHVCRYFYDATRVRTCRCENNIDDAWCLDFEEYSYAFIFFICIFILFFLISCCAFRLMYSKVSGEWTPVSNR